MAKKQKTTSRSRTLLYIVGSAIIGVVTLLIVLLSLIAAGVIDVTRTKLVFTSESQEFVYDGSAHTAGNWSLADGTLKDGHTAAVTVTASLTDVGETENALTATILDANGADVTESYNIEYQPGTLCQ